jgi:hypothetical protein
MTRCVFDVLTLLDLHVNHPADNVRLPQSALLNRYCSLMPDKAGSSSEYVLKEAGIRPFDMIGQRLYTGRVAVAQAALSYARRLFAVTQEYSNSKRIWAPSGTPALSSIPQLASLYDEVRRQCSSSPSLPPPPHLTPHTHHTHHTPFSNKCAPIVCAHANYSGLHSPAHLLARIPL